MVHLQTNILPPWRRSINNFGGLNYEKKLNVSTLFSCFTIEGQFPLVKLFVIIPRKKGTLMFQETAHV